MSKDNLVEITGLIVQGVKDARLHERRARAWRRYRRDIHLLCELANAGELSFEIRQTRQGVEAIRFGLDNVWHVNIPQRFDREDPKPVS